MTMFFFFLDIIWTSGHVVTPLSPPPRARRLPSGCVFVPVAPNDLLTTLWVMPLARESLLQIPFLIFTRSVLCVNAKPFGAAFTQPADFSPRSSIDFIPLHPPVPPPHRCHSMTLRFPLFAQRLLFAFYLGNIKSRALPERGTDSLSWLAVVSCWVCDKKIFWRSVLNEFLPLREE